MKIDLLCELILKPPKEQTDFRQISVKLSGSITVIGLTLESSPRNAMGTYGVIYSLENDICEDVFEKFSWNSDSLW